MIGNGALLGPSPGLPPRYLPSGLRFYDARTRGLRAGKRYVVGAPRGADAAIAALQIAFAGLERGEVVLLVSAEDPEALVMQGERAGMPLARFLIGDQCILLTYDRRFAQLVANPALAAGLLRDLQRKTNNRPLHRVVLLDEPVANGTTGKMREALDLLDTHVREQHGAVVVYVGDPAAGDDARHEELQRTAFGACLLEPQPGSHYGRFRLLKDPALAGGAVTGRLALRPEEGFVEVEAEPETVTVVCVGREAALPARLQDSLGTDFRVLAHDPQGALPLPAASGGEPLVVVEADAASPQALAVVDRIRQAAPAAPLLAMALGRARSADRIRLLRHGADEVIPHDTPLAEVRERLRRHAVRLGLLPPAPPELSRLEAAADLAEPGAVAPVPWGSFRRSTADVIDAMTRLGGDFTLLALFLRADAAGGAVERVAEALAAGLRAEDPCAISPDGVVVARLARVGRGDLEPVVARVLLSLEDAPACAGLEVVRTAVVFPHDGRDFDELYKGLVRERQAARRRGAQEPLPA